MKRIIRTLRKHRLIAAGIVLCSVFFVEQSCTKIDTSDLKGNIGQLSNAEITQQFFNVPANAPAALKRVAQEMKLRNAQNEFVPLFVKRYGYPVWDKPLITTGSNNAGTTQAFRNTATNSMGEDDSDTLVVLPLSREGSRYVNSFVTARIDSPVILNLYRGSDYSTYTYAATQGTQINADKAAAQIMYLNYYVYGHTKFTTTDVHLFSDGQPYTGQMPKLLKLEPEAEANLNHTYTLEVCVTSPTDDGCSCPGNNGNLATCTCTRYNCCWQRKCSYTDFGGFIGGEPQGGNGPTGTPGTPTNPGPGGNGPASGGGSSNPFPCPATQSPNNPIPGCNVTGSSPVIVYEDLDFGCDPYISVLENNTEFNNKLNGLRGINFNEQFEKGYKVGILSQAIYINVTGNTDQKSIDLYYPPGELVNGIMHTHYLGLAAMFSPQDVIDLSSIFLTGHALDKQNLFYTLSNADGSNYLIKVRDTAKFRNFANTIAVDSSAQSIFRKKYNDKLRSPNNSDNEIAFLQMMDKMKCGFDLYRGDANQGANLKWEKLRVSGNDMATPGTPGYIHVESTPCN